MSAKKSNQVKFILSILAMSSVAAFSSGVNAQTLKPDTTVDTFLNRANLTTKSTKIQDTKLQKLSPTVERINNSSKFQRQLDSQNSGGCTNTSCGVKNPSQQGRELITDPINRSGSLLNQSLPQIRNK
ncbi:hypothetical protein [Nostoc sp. NMS4]|uniref:hypothetical protein n=1 Tax=Nostoc sp. NMS4 TaxID=2815390 RepID=UPI0025F60C2A|nr:hypothetical protein [Nostoc sp. NMS4]MBN3926198.1 hypothetical protein [Nostoc sp. NMS4]